MDTKIYGKILNAGIITEREILLMKHRLNRGLKEVFHVLDEGPLMITPEQTKKGLDWLLDKYKTPRGVIRKNNPFNPRNASILENFDRFELVDFRNVSMYTWFYLPVYRVLSKSGSSFDYIVYSEPGSRIPITIFR